MFVNGGYMKHSTTRSQRSDQKAFSHSETHNETHYIHTHTHTETTYNYYNGSITVIIWQTRRCCRQCCGRWSGRSRWE